MTTELNFFFLLLDTTLLIYLPLYYKVIILVEGILMISFFLGFGDTFVCCLGRQFRWQADKRSHWLPHAALVTLLYTELDHCRRGCFNGQPHCKLQDVLEKIFGSPLNGPPACHNKRHEGCKTIEWSLVIFYSLPKILNTARSAQGLLVIFFRQSPY